MEDLSGTPEYIGSYRILETLGEGGMGVVYAAEQRQTIQRRVALKVIKWGMDTKEVLARFDIERQALAVLDHPNIAKVLDAGATREGRPFFAMELVRGLPITRYCDTNRLSLDERIDVFLQACAAVQHAHERGILHRDLKPTNILVTESDGEPLVKVIDFGLAKAMNQRLTERTLFTEEGRIIGTPEYMSPEQAETTAQDVDNRTDVFSLGVVLYELIAGALPLDYRTVPNYLELQRLIREAEPPTPSKRLNGLRHHVEEILTARRCRMQDLAAALRRGLDAVTMKAMAKQRRDRYASCAETAADLKRFRAGDPVLADKPRRLAALRAWGRRFHRRNPAVLPAVLVASVAAAATWWATYRPLPGSQAEASSSAGRAATPTTDAPVADTETPPVARTEPPVELPRIDPLRLTAPTEDAQRDLARLREHYLELRSDYTPTGQSGPGWQQFAYAMERYARTVQAAFLVPMKNHIERRLREFAASPVHAEALPSLVSFHQIYRALGRAYVADDRLRILIESENLWFWSPAELGKSQSVSAASETVRHLQAYVSAPRWLDCWIIGVDHSLIDQVELRLRASGHLELFVRRELEQSPTLRGAAEEDLKQDMLARVRAQSGADVSMSTEQVARIQWIASDQRKQLESERIAGIGIERPAALEELVQALDQAGKAESEQLQTVRGAVRNLRLGGALPPLLPGKDPIVDGYASCLIEIARLRTPVQELVSAGAKGQRIVPEFLKGRQDRLDAFNQMVHSVRTAVQRRMLEVKVQGDVDLQPFEHSIERMLDTVIEGVAREIRAEAAALWEDRGGRELKSVQEYFPFHRALDALDVAPERFQELFRPGGRIDEALGLLARIRAMDGFGRKLESGERFAALENRVRAIQSTCFDPAAPQAPARLQFHVASMRMGVGVSDLTLCIHPGERVSKSSGSPAMISRPVRTWLIGRAGTSVVMELTVRERGLPVVLVVPTPADVRANSAWGFLRVLAAAETAILQDQVGFTWTPSYAGADDVESRSYPCSIALQPEGSENPFDPGFFVLPLTQELFPEWLK